MSTAKVSSSCGTTLAACTDVLYMRAHWLRSRGPSPAMIVSATPAPIPVAHMASLYAWPTLHPSHQSPFTSGSYDAIATYQACPKRCRSDGRQERLQSSVLQHSTRRIIVHSINSDFICLIKYFIVALLLAIVPLWSPIRTLNPNTDIQIQIGEANYRSDSSCAPSQIEDGLLHHFGN